MRLAIKAFGDFQLDVLAVPFGSPTDRDRHGQYFDASTKLFLDKYDPLILYYHAFDKDGQPQGEPEVIGESIKRWIDKAGVWLRVKLDQANEYARKVWEAGKAGGANASSGTLEHLVRVDDDGHISFWPLAELSLWEQDPERPNASPYAVAFPAYKSACNRAKRPVPALFETQAQAAQESGNGTGGKKGALFFNPDIYLKGVSTMNYGIFKMPDGSYAICNVDESGEMVGEPVQAGLASEADADAALAALAQPATQAAEPPAEAAKPVRIKMASIVPVNPRAAAPAGASKLTHAEQQFIIEQVWKRIEQDPALKSFGVANRPAAQAPDAKAAQAMKAFGQALRGNAQAIKALQADSDTAGGFITAPAQFSNDLLKAVDDVVYIRQWAQAAGVVFQLEKAQSLGVPVLDNDPADADWTVELATGSEDSTMSFGGRTLTPHPVAKRIKVSNKLIRQSRINVVDLVKQRLAYKFGLTAEKAYLTGNGSEKPLGVFTASAQGISTGRDVTASSTTAFTADDLIDLKHSVKAQYWPRLKWIVSREFIKRARKLKDGNGQYLWQPGLGGNPDTLIDVPYVISEHAPSTFTTGLYVALLGDFSFYWIAEALDFQTQVLDQLYAETNQTGYIGRLETDGMPVLEEAFARLKLA